MNAQADLNLESFLVAMLIRYLFMLKTNQLHGPSMFENLLSAI